MTTTAPIGCGRCTNRWSGRNTMHCGGCHQTFTGLTAFDQHRTGNHAHGTRTCLQPQNAGLTRTNRAYPCWGQPNDGKNPYSAPQATKTPPQAP